MNGVYILGAADHTGLVGKEFGFLAECSGKLLKDFGSEGGMIDLNSYNDNAQVIDVTPAPFCAICKRDSQPGSPGSSAPSQPPCPPPDCCPPRSTPVLASRRIKS